MEKIDNLTTPLMTDLTNQLPLTKKELIENLYRTDELMSEVQILKHECYKKHQLKEAQLEKLRNIYVAEALTRYHESDEVLDYEDYQIIKQNVANFKKVAILLALIMSVFIGTTLLYMQVDLALAIGTMVILPIILIFVYQLVALKIVKDKEVDVPKTDVVVVREARKEPDYLKIYQDFSIRDLEFELQQLEQKVAQGYERLNLESVLKEENYEKSRRLIYFLTNDQAENLREALILLTHEEERQALSISIQIHETEITALREQTKALQNQVDQLQDYIERYNLEIEMLKTRK